MKMQLNVIFVTTTMLCLIYNIALSQERRIEISPTDTITLLEPQVVVRNVTRETFFGYETEVSKFQSQDQVPIADRQMFEWLGGLVHTIRPKGKCSCDTTEFRNLMKGLIFKNRKRYFQQPFLDFSFAHSLDCLPIDHNKPVLFLYMEVGPEGRGHTKYRGTYKVRGYQAMCVLIDPRDGHIKGLSVHEGSGNDIGSPLIISGQGFHGNMKAVLLPFIKELERRQKAIDRQNTANKM